jgi:hypothetical protein
MKPDRKIRNVYNCVVFSTSDSIQDEKLYSSVYYLTDVISSQKVLSIATINLQNIVKDMFKSISND